jgi:hypothetical protein
MLQVVAKAKEIATTIAKFANAFNNYGKIKDLSFVKSLIFLFYQT